MNKTIADAASTSNDGDLDTIGEFRAAMQAAIVAVGFDATSFSLTDNGTEIKLQSTSTGPNSEINFAGGWVYDDGTSGGTFDATTTGFGDLADAGTNAATATITIGDGTNTTGNIVLNGDDHDTPEKARTRSCGGAKRRPQAVPASSSLPLRCQIRRQTHRPRLS
ncbi:hypothetical protein SAMN06295905_0998 [Devosia lucknowensis]|uniref:Uncharacterized protein n=1 Tax=Devosia lucknowensis TaxID=1096929 RepID=A0A1Y6EQA1_9HYPH|nr:hypothetical protein [Devosia lucknowensis]SMQ64516.1 hypothetical protein SAMN06295905_0998 [Devosia lucknowensis]